MKAEFLKVRSLPTPRWCFIAVSICFILGFIASMVWGIGSDSDATDIAISAPLTIASIIFGVWMFGVEYGQKTLRQVLTADPRRARLILSKLAVLISVIVAVTLFFYVLSIPFYSLGAHQHGQHLSMDFLFRSGADTLYSNVVYALVGAAFALITASMAGGMTMALVFVFVLDSIFSLIPKVGDYSFGQATTVLSDSIRGNNNAVFGSDPVGHTPAVAILTIVVWLVILLVIGFNRFRTADVK